MIAPADVVRSSSSHLELHELLKKPASELLGVSASAAAALAGLGTRTVFDLGTSFLFGTARAAVEIARLGTPSARLGIATGDLLSDRARYSSLDEIPTLPLDGLRMLTAAAAQALSTALDITTIRDLAYWPPYVAARLLVGESVGSTADPEEIQAEELRPRFGQYPTERVYYSTLVLLERLGEEEARRRLDGPVSLDPAVKDRGLTRPALGALLTFSQSWYAQGVTLGHLLHSLALAPGEATRIAVVDWARRTSAFSAETIAEGEQLDSATQHARAISEVQQAVASDFQAGGSQSSSSSSSDSSSGAVAAGTGLLPGLWGNADASGTTQSASTSGEAASSGWSIGNRSVMGSMVQNVNDRTEQHSTSVRNRRAAAVREVSQSEHEQVSTRIVANYNHMHALTVQYYEVVQVYRVAAELHRADRCLFVPMELLDFSPPEGLAVVDRFRGALARAALNRRIRALLVDDTTAVEIRPAVPVRFAGLHPELADIAAVARLEGRARAADVEPPQADTSPSTARARRAASMSGVRLWDETAVAQAARVVDRPLLRLDSDSLFVPDDTELTSISFDGLNVRSVRLDQAGADDSADQTFTVPTDSARVDLPRHVRLIELDAIHVGKSEEAPRGGTMSLHCAYLGRRFSLPAVPVELGQGTALQRVATFQSDQADRRRELLHHLQGEREHYSRAVFRSLDPATLTLILSGYEWNGRPLIDQVEPQPVRVAGNYLVLRAPVENGEDSGVRETNGRPVAWRTLLEHRGLELGQQPDQRLIPLPTGGVFAEAVLGRSNSAEKLDLTRFWHWQDSPIPLTPTEIAPVQMGTRATPEDLKPGQLGAPVLNLVNPTSLPDPAGLGAALGALSSLNFRDMSGLAATQGLVQAGMSGTLQAASEAGRLASENLRTEAQKAIAMGQIAADIVKSALGVPSFGGSIEGISGSGALINQGRRMDEEAAARAAGPDGAGGNGGGAIGGGGSSSPTGSSGGGVIPSGGLLAGDGSGSGGFERQAFQKATWGPPGASGPDAARIVLASFPGAGPGAGASPVIHPNQTDPTVPRSIFCFYGYSGDGLSSGTFPEGTDANQMFQRSAETVADTLRQVYRQDTVTVMKAWSKDTILDALRSADRLIRQVHIFCHSDEMWMSLAFFAEEGKRVRERAQEIDRLEIDGRAATEEEKALETLKQEEALACGFLTRALDAQTRQEIWLQHAPGASWQIWGCYAGNPTTRFKGFPGDPVLHPYFMRLNFGQKSMDGIAVEIAKAFGVTCTASAAVPGRGGVELWVPTADGKVRKTEDDDRQPNPWWMWPNHNSRWVTYEWTGAERRLANLFGRDREAADLPRAAPPLWFTQGYSVPSPSLF